VVKKGLDLAAEPARSRQEDVEFSQGKYRVKGTDLAISFERSPARYASSLDTLGSVPTAATFPARARPEVEIDPETGTVEWLSLRRGRRLRPRHQPCPARGAAPRRHPAGHRQALIEH